MIALPISRDDLERLYTFEVEANRLASFHARVLARASVVKRRERPGERRDKRLALLLAWAADTHLVAMALHDAYLQAARQATGLEERRAPS